ncbi:glycerophosphodiester phosphodiesterase [Nostoc sp. UHCC 0926]|uniref:glycerophosphodiester phosphodiesterase n=1 Tax=unclassified Nostoc TaxID=2593658 RepID=UPI00235F89D2|nr:glycerophosphodiester phosphodiesterase [Nostoc sp. UHCC 0926]WDD31018.1 glycerophosphodiester phosphodiesterase [Nostoc sp. UHCC 0926]
MLRLKGYVLFLCFFLALSVSLILGSINFVHAIDLASHNPNLPKLNTLYGQPPIVIGHRGGGTGYRPEHTVGDFGHDLIGSHNLGIEFGADYIEPDLVVTKDGVLIVRHEPLLATVKTDNNGNIVYDAHGKPTIQEATTNVADVSQFAKRLTTKVLDGNRVTGWFAEDFTLPEIKKLRAIERLPSIRPQNTKYNGLFQIPTFDEVINLAKHSEAKTGRKIGIYPETKHPTYFAEAGKYLDGTPIHVNTSQLLIEQLVANGYTNRDRIFIQSFEVSNLKELKNKIMPAAGVDIPLIQLIDSSGAPYDFIYHKVPQTYANLITPKGLTQVKTYATGIGPDKRLIVPVSARLNKQGQPIDINGDGQISDADKFLGQPTSLVSDAHNAGLLLHPYTFRSDSYFLSPDYHGQPLREYEQFIKLGIDGYFTDFANFGYVARQKAIHRPVNLKELEYGNFQKSTNPQ